MACGQNRAKFGLVEWLAAILTGQLKKRNVSGLGRGADRLDRKILILVIFCRRSGARDPGLERIRPSDKWMISAPIPSCCSSMTTS